MELDIKKAVNLKTKSVDLESGIKKSSGGGRAVKDSVNLEFDNGKCISRTARKAVFSSFENIEQTVVCGTDLYFIINNTLKKAEIVNGEITFTGFTVPLDSIYSGKQRSVIKYGQKLYVFPDTIIVDENSDWKNYADGYTAAVKFPFTSGTTMTFYNGYYSEVNASLIGETLENGLEFKFSWDSGIYRIIKYEKIFDNINNAIVLIGTRVTFDRAVSGWSQISASSTALIRKPFISDMAYTYKVFPKTSGTISGKQIDFTFETSNSKSFIDYPNKHFFNGQVVEISGCGEINGRHCISNVSETSISFTDNLGVAKLIKNKAYEIKAYVPHSALVTESNQRFIVADNESSRIWISQKSNPCVYKQNPSDDNDGCIIEYSNDSVIKKIVICGGEAFLFTLSGIYRIYGDSALNYELAPVNYTGIKNGCENSVVSCKNFVLYQGLDGICKYTSGNVKSVSFSAITLPDIVSSAEAYGKCFFAATDRIYVYDTQNECWYTESNDGVRFIFEYGGELYIVIANSVYRSGGGKAKVKWMLSTGTVSNSDLDGRIIPVIAKISLQSKNGAEVFLKQINDSGFENRCGHISVTGKKTLTFPLSKMPCDGFNTELSGNGDIIISGFNIFYRGNR